MAKVSAETLRLHLDYSAWASARLLDAAAQLSPAERDRDFQTADHSVIDTLAHIYAADRAWLGRIEGQSPDTFGTPDDSELVRLQTEWPGLHDRWKSWAAGLTDESVSEGCSYKDMRGNPHNTPLWQIVLHVVNHATHHRGQVSGFLRAMNKKPPALDLMAFYRETAAT